MLQQKREGNKPDRAFPTTAYANMVKELNEKLPTIGFTKQNLKNRLKTLKKDFSICYDTFKSNSGFAWSPVTKLWNAEPEVWKELTEAKSDAAKWMTKPVNNYDKLKELFAQDRARGDGAETSKEKKRRWEKVMETRESITINDIDLDDDITLESYGNDFSDGFNVMSPLGPSQVIPSNGKKKKVSHAEK